MPQMIQNADGTQTEHFSQKEVDEKIKSEVETATKTATDAAVEVAKKSTEEQLEQYKKDNPPAADEIEKLKDTIAERDTKIIELEDDGKGGSGDGDDKNTDEQIKRLKEENEKSVKDLETKMNSMGESMTQITGDIKNDMINTVVGNATEAQLEKAGGKEELKKLISTEYDGFSGDVVTREDIGARVTKAVTIIVGATPETPGVLDSALGAGGKGEGSIVSDKTHATNKEPSEAQTKVARNLGITEEDEKKYGPGGEGYKQSSSHESG